MMRRIKHAVLLEYTLLVCSILPLVFATSAAVYSGNLFSGGLRTPLINALSTKLT